MNFVSKIFTSVLFWSIVGAIVAGVMVWRYFFPQPVELNVDYRQQNLRQDDLYYRSIADSLENAMATPSGFGTDEKMIFSLTESLNVDEVKKVYSVFGQRKYAGDSFLSSRPLLDLVDWFKAELTGDDLERVMVVFSSVWH